MPASLVILSVLLLCGQGTSALSENIGCETTLEKPGYYTHFPKHGGISDTCLTIIKSPSTTVIEIEIVVYNLPCDASELAFINGLNLNEDFFPSAEHEGGNRFRMLCSNTEGRSVTLRSDQNVASLLFRFSHAKRGFRMRVRFLENPKPCNIVANYPNETGKVILSNHGRRANCSLLVLHPTEFSVLNARVGSGRYCDLLKRDYFEIRSGHSLDPLKLNGRLIDSCKLLRASKSAGVFPSVYSPCYASFVRLVSSGAFNNILTISFKPMDLGIAATQCPAI